MQRFFSYYLIFLSVSFLILTFAYFNLDLREHKRIFIVLRDGLWRGSFVYLLLSDSKRSFTILKKKKIWILTVLLVFLTIWSLSVSHGTNITQLIMWFKYDIYPLWLLWSSLLLGSLRWKITDSLSFNTKKKGHGAKPHNTQLTAAPFGWRCGEEKPGLRPGPISSKVQSLYDNRKRWEKRNSFHFQSFTLFLYRLLWIVIIGGIVFQITKILLPDFWTWFGFGELGDFTPWHRPPLYYRTWPWGLMRLSWLFPWPNVLWFFLVLFSPRLVYQTKQYYGKKHAWASGVFLLIITLTTFSRWALWGLRIASALYILITLPRKRYIIIFSTLILGLSTRTINLTKQGSNTERSNGLDEALISIEDNYLIGHGLWSSGPSLHYVQGFTNTDEHPLALLENIYIQRVYDIWVIWIWLIAMFFCVWLWWTRSLWKQTGHHWFLLMSCGLIWLLAEGLFLHVFIDSIINLFFFSCYCIIIWHALSWKQSLRDE